jgi:histidinol phosphatase-like PHP family hydrolase
MDFLKLMFPAIMDQIINNLPDIIGYLGVLLVGLLPQIARKLAIKKIMDRLKVILEKYGKAIEDDTITEKEYAEIGKEMTPFLDELYGKLNGFIPWKSGK